ncbi:MAG: valine--tRNA ligase [Acidobacteriaceae bacterium]|nr:valine--tRNA ligase [Acidobacteriaceae bacterium]
MSMQLEKVYEPQRFEPHWAQWWIESGIYRADANSATQGRAFSLVIPPPNVTGSLHIGHMFEHTMMDVAVRWHRMKGQATLWLPGTDHAGIATQMVVERFLASENITRRQLGRAEFERRVWQWKEEYGGKINNQIRREGASVDWSRERFTMDAGLSRAVRETFVRLWDRGLIYRGEYMVNWCPRCQTAISDLETTHEAVEGQLWHVRYRIAGSDEYVTVATTRPETMLGDTAVAVHPADPRYRHLLGKSVILPLMNREIPVVTDAMVDPKFGTGVVKITPAHDPNDFEAAKRHNLPFIKVIDEDARMTAAAGRYAGLDRFQARKRVLAALEETGDLVETEPYTVSVSKCERCKTIIEPLVSTQWFVHMKPLSEKAMEAVRTGQIRFVPNDREALFFQWMENIRDWCISRQLWWGHRIPAWHCRNCRQITVARETPVKCQHCHSTELEQESDVLDTWFSSGLWPFSTLGWPDDTEDLRAFYPTSLMITGFDILFFWVSRMIMLGIEMTGDVPFREVHIHGLVRDAGKQKMSKTKGNVIDPLVIMDKYGTDACRIALLISAAAGSDIALKEDRMDSGSGFANKIWNASRLLFLNMDRSGIANWKRGIASDPALEDQWIRGRLDACARAVNEALSSHRYHEAGQALWDFVWHDFCDWYLEIKKLRFRENSGQDDHWTEALTVYETMLRLLHPFMPFITEELWQRLVDSAGFEHAISISLEHYPQPRQESENTVTSRQFGLLQEVVRAARELRADNKLDPKATLAATLYLHSLVFDADNLTAIAALSKLMLEQKAGSAPGTGGLIRATPDFDLIINAPASAQNGSLTPETRLRIEKDIAAKERAIENSRRQLSDQTFLNNAPPHVIDAMRAKLADYEAQVAKNRKLLDG